MAECESDSLKSQVELPLDIHNDNATYKTQFGHIQRPTHRNTKLDIAKFEVCGHKVRQSYLTLLELQIFIIYSPVCRSERIRLRRRYFV